MAGNIKISKYCASMAQTFAMSDPFGFPDIFTLASLMDQGELLDLQFTQWHRGLPDVWLPRKALSPRGDTMILHPDITSVEVWNHYCGTRMILH